MEQNITLQHLSDKLDRLAWITGIGVKNDLQIEEAAAYLGLSTDYLYNMTRARKIPFSKQARRLYFNKAELDRWIERNRVLTTEEIQAKAATYVATHK